MIPAIATIVGSTAGMTPRSGGATEWSRGRRRAWPEHQHVARRHVRQHHRPYFLQHVLPARGHVDLHRARPVLGPSLDSHRHQRFSAKRVIHRRLEVGLEWERAILVMVKPRAPNERADEE